MLAQAPNFGSPIVLVAGVLSTWLLVFFPLALLCRRLARPDALNSAEAYLLGQFCGPVGVWLVLRANRGAADRAHRTALHVEQLKLPDGPAPGLKPQQIQQELRELGRPGITEMPGGQAFRAPPRNGIRPAAGTTPMDTVGLSQPENPDAGRDEPRPPLEPPPPPLTKSAGAWRPPPPDYKFTHSDEQPGEVNGDHALD